MKTINLICLLVCVVSVDVIFGQTIDVYNRRILGGDDAEAGQFPYQVSLRSVRNGHFCGGAIISKRSVTLFQKE